jgi:hypothetical protein
MYRARIGVAAAAVVALLTVAVTISVGSSLNTVATQQVQGAAEHAQAAFPALDLLRGIELTNETARMAREEQFGDVFTKGSDDDKRQAAFVEVSARNARLDAQGRKADLVAVVGANGHVVSRDLNINALYDEDLKTRYPSVGKALEGQANKDVWSFDGHMMRVAAAPIRSKMGSVVGALVVGYVASAKDALSDHERLGTEVAYFLDAGDGGKLQASSFKKQGGESAEEKALAAQLFGGDKLAAPALNGEITKPFHVRIGGEEYIAAAGPLPGNISKSRSGFVVLSSLTAARAPIVPAQSWIILLGIVALIAAVGAAVLTALRFISPLDKIESGVAEVINGNREYSFESPGQDFEGLANALNVMIARLTGRPDPTDDEFGEPTATGNWRGELAVDDQASTTGPQMSPENAQLAAEPEADYLQRTYAEWLAGRKQTGEGTDGLTFDGFVAKLRQNEGALKGKYNCSSVRFKVVIKNNQTTLKPVPIA